MLTKKIAYTDFNGDSRIEVCNFNMTEAELTEMEMRTPGGMQAYITRIINAHDNAELTNLFKELILMSYGVKSDDGRRFIKNEQLREEFSQTGAYSALFMELVSDSDAAAKFVNGIIPAELARKIKETPSEEVDKFLDQVGVMPNA